MSSVILVLQVFVCFLMIALILLQPSKGGSFFTASNQGVFGSSGGTTFLFRATMWCALFLALTCLGLSWYRVHQTGESVVSDAPLNTPPGALVPSPAAPAPNNGTGTAPLTTSPATGAPVNPTQPAASPGGPARTAPPPAPAK